MPESKHRRKGKVRPRPTRSAPPVKNPAPSPNWIPATGVGLIIGGVAIILLGYLDFVQTRTAGLPALGSNWPLVFGFILLTAGFGFLTRWR